MSRLGPNDAIDSFTFISPIQGAKATFGSLLVSFCELRSLLEYNAS